MYERKMSRCSSNGFAAISVRLTVMQGSLAGGWHQENPSIQKQGQKLVLSDALAVQSQSLLDFIGYQGRKVSSLKVVMGSKKVHWDLKNSFGISKNALGSQKMY